MVPGMMADKKARFKMPHMPLYWARLLVKDSSFRSTRVVLTRRTRKKSTRLLAMLIYPMPGNYLGIVSVMIRLQPHTYGKLLV
jgi:hypothetical protein